MYVDYIERLHSYFETEADRIEAEHGFEHGPEFEQVLKEAIRNALPEKYGVDNGYVVDPSGDAVGDDIVIYERLRYPTLRNSSEGQRKNRIPREAVYCYIEAKHSICLRGDGGQSLTKALQQVASAKRLIEGREDRPLSKPGKLNLGDAFSVSSSEGYPERRNPPYGAIFAKQVRPAKGKPPLKEVPEILKTFVEGIDQSQITLPNDQSLCPDLFVLGTKTVGVPQYPRDGQDDLFRPFQLPGETELKAHVAEQGSFGTGFTALMSALEWVELGDMPWSGMLANSVIPPDI